MKHSLRICHSTLSHFFSKFEFFFFLLLLVLFTDDLLSPLPLYWVLPLVALSVVVEDIDCAEEEFFFDLPLLFFLLLFLEEEDFDDEGPFFADL